MNFLITGAAGFLGSKGAKFGADLPRQREETDRRAKRLDSSAQGLSGEARSAFRAAGSQLARLPDTRKAIGDLSLAPKASSSLRSRSALARVVRGTTGGGSPACRVAIAVCGDTTSAWLPPSPARCGSTNRVLSAF